MFRHYFCLSVLIALLPLLAIAACGSQATTPFGAAGEDSGAPPTVVGSDGGVVFDSSVPILGISDDASKPVAADAGGWVEQPDGGWLFEGDAGGWVQLSDGGWAFEGDAGGWVQLSDGGWLFTGDAGGGGCINLQCQQGTCAGGGSATLTGHVWDPAGNNPLYKVVAYVPNADPDPITDGVNSNSCSCDSLYTGSPVASGISAADGSFTITNAPVGANIPIVIQIGKWRNYFTIPNVVCGPNDLDTLTGMPKLTLPKTETETQFSNIPSIAISTGGADTLECIMARIGVNESEYTGSPTSTTGHIHIFQGSGGTTRRARRGPRARRTSGTRTPTSSASTSSCSRAKGARRRIRTPRCWPIT